MRTAILVVSCALAGWVLAGCGGSTAAVSVNGTSIGRATLEQELTYIRETPAALAQLGAVSGKGLDGFTPDFVASVLTSEIQAAVVGAEARRRHVSVAAPLAAAVAAVAGGGFTSYPAAYQRIIAGRTGDRLALAAALSNASIAPAAIQAYYRDHLDQFTQYCVSGLAVGSAASASAIRTRLVAGADLAGIARAQSVDPTTASNGGVLGCGDIGVFPSFDAVLPALALGEYSQPVEVGLVWYVVKLTQRAVSPPAVAAPTIVQALITQYGPFNTFLERALTAATVKVDPGLGRWDRGTAPPSVVAAG